MRRTLTTTGFLLLALAAIAFSCGAKNQEQAEAGGSAAKQGASAAVGSQSTAEEIAQKTCPVMGNPVNRELYVDYQGKRIYVCCGGCIEQVKNDPEKYLKKLEELGEKAETIKSSN